MCSIMPDIDWGNIPIPEEIENLDKYLNKRYQEFSEDVETGDDGGENANKYKQFTFSLFQQFIVNMNMKESVLNRPDVWLRQTMTKLSREYHMIPSKSHLVKYYRQLIADKKLETMDAKPTMSQCHQFELMIRKKPNRSTSGIVNITMLLGPGQHSCRANCAYCPDDPAISRSYLLDEPAVRRGFSQGWDPIRQFLSSANRLYNMGHPVTKVEVILEGGTFTNYPHDYINDYFRDFYYAANTFQQAYREKLSLQEEITLNQSAECAIIGVTIETRPDWISGVELKRYRNLGITRIQIGIQHLDDEILDKVNRQCPTEKTIKAIRLIKENGFKCDGHFMPDLPGSDFNKDMEMFKYLFSNDNENFQCDQLKIYPTMTLKYTQILDWYNSGQYKPYAELDGGKWINELMTWICLNIPPWIRINRMVRDMPMTYSHGGIDKPNMRQEIEDNLKSQRLIPKDIRGREVKGRPCDPSQSKFWIDKYRSSGGDEYFISYENMDRTILYGFVRLRIGDPVEPKTKDDVRKFECLKGNTGLIRELHVYGQLVKQEHNKQGSETQHMGIGKRLMAYAEDIAKQRQMNKIAVIAGVGVRGYYAKLGYILTETYMVKTFT